MTVTIAAWGNSLGLRIPKTAALEAHLAVGDRVDIQSRDGELVITKSTRPTLDELLVGFPFENCEPEMFATLVGKYIW